MQRPLYNGSVMALLQNSVVSEIIFAINVTNVYGLSKTTQDYKNQIKLLKIQIFIAEIIVFQTGNAK